jgi:hypothetical protein
MLMMGSVISWSWKMYDSTELLGESQPLQKSLARTFIDLLPAKPEAGHLALLMVGSVPLTV